ncbi:hypothetical protein [Hyphomicrobium sp. 1Nfss2.1]
MWTIPPVAASLALFAIPVVEVEPTDLEAALARDVEAINVQL